MMPWTLYVFNMYVLCILCMYKQWWKLILIYYSFNLPNGSATGSLMKLPKSSINIYINNVKHVNYFNVYNF